jgi:hypothetical protein
MREDSGPVVPAQVDEPAYFNYEKPTEAAELKIFLLPAGHRGERGWMAVLAVRLRRAARRARYGRHRHR